MTDTKPTPQTDAIDTYQPFIVSEPKYNAMAELCRTLERELAAIKSQPVPDVVCYYTANVNNREVGTILMGDNLKLTFDGETGELKSAEVLK